MRVYQTTIHSNGSRNYGEPPASIDDLIGLMGLERLAWDNANMVPFVCQLGETAHFWGNFDRVSHSFDITTNDPELISRLIDAIKINGALQETPNVTPEAMQLMCRTKTL